MDELEEGNISEPELLTTRSCLTLRASTVTRHLDISDVKPPEVRNEHGESKTCHGNQCREIKTENP